MSNCEHAVYGVFTLYRRGKPGKVEVVKCDKCGAVNKAVMELLQERENKVFEVYGFESPVTFLKPYMDWVEEKRLVDRDDPNIKVSGKKLT